MVSILAWIIYTIVVFMAGFELGRLYRRLNAQLISIRRAVAQPAKAPEKETTAGAVIVPSRIAASEPVDLSEDSGGVMPMSPRGVALENARAEREGR